LFRLDKRNSTSKVGEDSSTHCYGGESNGHAVDV
jgi:hypothetical protein